MRLEKLNHRKYSIYTNITLRNIKGKREGIRFDFRKIKLAPNQNHNFGSKDFTLLWFICSSLANVESSIGSTFSSTLF